MRKSKASVGFRRAAVGMLAVVGIALVLSYCYWQAGGSQAGDSENPKPADNGAIGSAADESAQSANAARERTAPAENQAEATAADAQTQAQQPELPTSLPSAGSPGLPVDLPLGLTPASYKRNTASESWQFLSELACRDYARATLLSLQASGSELIESGYLDLIGECWGCVVQDSLGRSLSVVLLPEDVFQARGSENRLRVTVLHYLPPEEV